MAGEFLDPSRWYTWMDSARRDSVPWGRTFPPQVPDDPWERAAYRTRQSVRPDFGRVDNGPMQAAASSAMDPFGFPSWLLGQISPEARDAWRAQYETHPTAALVGSVLGPAPGVKFATNLLGRAITAAPKTSTGVLGSLGATIGSREAGEQPVRGFAWPDSPSPPSDADLESSSGEKEAGPTFSEMVRPNLPDATLAAAAMIPGSRGGRLRMNEASRMARATRQGYADEPFYRGERDGSQPTDFPEGAFFSRDRKYEDEFARVGGAAEAPEYRLKLDKVFDFDRPVTAAAYGRLIGALRESHPKLAADMVDFVAPGKNVDWFMEFAHRIPNQIVSKAPSHVHHIIDFHTRDAPSIFARAGYDAIDTGRDVQKVTGAGIRSVKAAFDPAKRNSHNIMASI